MATAQLQDKVSQAKGGFSSQSNLSEETHIYQEWACLGDLTVLSPSMGAARGKHGFHMNMMVDP